MTHSMKRIVTLVPYRVTYKDGPNYGKDAHGFMNDDTVKLIKDRYLVLRNVIPKEITDFALDTWKTIEPWPDAYAAVFDEELEPIPNSPVSSHNTSRGGHTTPMGVAMHRWLHKELDKRLDIELEQTYSFSRKYDRGAYLRAHSDRPSCEISATICLGYQSDNDKPWKIWLDNTRNWVDTSSDPAMNENKVFEQTQGIPIRKRKNAIDVDLEVGDILLYHGPNVVHWRDTFMGDYSYHMFLHYYTKDASKLSHCGQSGAEFHYEASEWSREKIGVLRYDGRENPYMQQDIDSMEHEKMTNWVKGWEVTHNKSFFVNNYEHLEFTKIEE